MLHQQMRSADLATICRPPIRARAIGTHLGRAVVRGHVGLELLRVGSRRGLPAGRLLRLVEVVGQVLGIRVAHLPAAGQSCVGLVGFLVSIT